MPTHPGSRPEKVWAEITSGDALGRGHQPALSWWLPPGSSLQHAYRLRTDDGFETGRVDSRAQSFVRLPVFDRSRRSAGAQVKVWTDLGESDWSNPVRLEADLLADEDWVARWIGIDEDPRPAPGSRPAYWLRTSFDVPPFSEARLYVTALGLYEAFLDGQRVGDAELTPGYTQYRMRVQYQVFDITSLMRPGRHVLAVLLADGWYRGQVGLPRAADQYGEEVALRAQLEVRTLKGWQVAAASDPGWHAAPSHITAADLIGGQREDRRRLDPAVHDPAIDDTAFDGRPWRPAVTRDVGAAVVRSIAPPVRRVQQIRPVTVRPGRDRGAFVVDFGQNVNGWVRLARTGPAGGTADTVPRRVARRRGGPDHGAPRRRPAHHRGAVAARPGQRGRLTRRRRRVRAAVHHARLPVRPRRGSSRAAGAGRHHGRRGALRPAQARLVRLQRQPRQPAPRGGGVVAALEHLRRPDRLPAARAGRLDRGLAGLRADGRLLVRCPRLHPQVAGGPVTRPARRRVRAEYVAVPACRRLRRTARRADRLRRVGQRRRVGSLGPLPGVRGRLAAGRDVERHDGLGPVRGGRRRGRPASGPGRGATRTRRARAVPVGYRLSLGRVDGARSGRHRLSRIRAGRQIRDGHGLPVPLGGDRRAGRGRARAA